MSMSSFSAPRDARGVIANLALAIGWPARALEERRAQARLAELSERERQDIGGARVEAAEALVEETPAERQARLRAIRAWYGHHSKAA